MEERSHRDLLYESARSAVWRERSTAGPVVVKAPNTVPIHEREMRYYRRAEKVSVLAPDLTLRTTFEVRRGIPHLTTAASPGQTLENLVATDPLSLEDALGVAVNLAGTLGRFHDLGLVHADLEPGNVWLDNHWRTYLLDLESVEGLEHEANSSYRGGGVLSPEHADPDRTALDSRSDLYGFGLILLNLLGCSDLVDQNSPKWSVWLRKDVDPADIEAQDVPPMVARIAARLMTARSADRYQSAGVVASDLQRCLNALSVAGEIADFDIAEDRVASALELDVELVDREPELAVLADLVSESSTQRGSIAIVHGSPGSGKSALLRSFAAEVSATGAVVAYGKIEQGQAEPYAALAHAFSHLVLEMLGARPGEFEAWQAELEATVRPTGAALASLVPDLRLVLPNLEPVVAVHDAEARTRLHRTMAALLHATSLIRPVVLVIDDLQWAASDTAVALKEFASSLPRNYVFIGAHRSGEYDASAVASDEAITTVELDGLSEHGIRTLLANALGESAALDDVARIIFERSAGNPLFAKQLIRHAEQQGLLRFEALAGRWVWDRPGLAGLSASETVIDLLIGSIEQLPTAHATVVSSIACIGGAFSLRDAQAASDSSEADVADALWAALELRLIEPNSLGAPGVVRVLDPQTNYRFSHDRVAEAAISRLSGEERQAAHLRFGRQILRDGSHPPFAVARHLNEGLMLVNDAGERLEIARLNLEAAQLARQQMDFSLALDLYESGISLLGGAGWTDQNAMTAALHLGAAEASLLVGDTSRSHEWLDAAEPYFARDSAEAAQSAFTRMRTLAADHRLQEAIETAVAALGALGETLPANASKAAGGAAIVKARFKLRSWDDEQILALPLCEDARVLQVDHILGELLSISYLARPELFPLIINKGITLTLDHGRLPISPVAIANHGLLLVAAFNRYEECQRWGELGLALCETGPFERLRPWVEFIYFNFISHWKHPMRHAIEPLLEAHRNALVAGEVDYAGWAAVAAIYQSFNLGLPLSEVDAMAERLIPTFRGKHVQTMLGQSTQQLCLNLMGRAEEPFLLAGESGFDEREALAIGEAQGDVVTVSATAISKMGLHFWHGDFRGAIAHAETVETYLEGMSGTPNVPTFHLVNAVSRLRVDPRSRQTRRAVSTAIKLFKKWGDACDANYGTSRDLLLGMRARAAGKAGEAEKYLDQAVSLGDEHRLPQYAALAREELGALYLDSGRASLARAVIRDAYEQWRNIGTASRHEWLAAEHPWLDNAQQASSVGSIDVQSVLEISQALSGEIQLDQLLRRLIDSSCELTGATRAMLFTPDTSRPRCRVHRDQTVTTIVSNTVTDIRAPYTLIRYVERTGRPLLLDDAATSSHASDPYIRDTSTHSNLTIPIRIKDSVVAVLYLEAASVVGAFSIEHQQLLMMLSGQIGASLQNAQLVDQLEEALDSQTALTSAQSRFIPDEFLELFGREDISSVRLGDTVQRRMTILISDIRGYTRMVEQLSLAEAGRMAIDFLQSVEPSIIGNNGFVQDMRGDEVLALFTTGAADAVHAGLAMQRSQQVHNALRQGSGGPIVTAGIGITTGEVMLSMVGGVNRMTCGVIGDAVNLAARIEGLNKRYGSGVLVDEQTMKELPPGLFSTRRMERVRVVNRREPVTVYEVYDDDEPELKELKRQAQPAFDRAFALFDDGHLDLAATAFAHCQTLMPGDQVAAWHHDYCISRGEEDVVDLRVTELSEK